MDPVTDVVTMKAVEEYTRKVTDLILTLKATLEHHRNAPAHIAGELKIELSMPNIGLRVIPLVDSSSIIMAARDRQSIPPVPPPPDQTKYKHYIPSMPHTPATPAANGVGNANKRLKMDSGPQVDTPVSATTPAPPPEPVIISDDEDEEAAETSIDKKLLKKALHRVMADVKGHVSRKNDEIVNQLNGYHAQWRDKSGWLYDRFTKMYEEEKNKKLWMEDLFMDLKSTFAMELARQLSAYGEIDKANLERILGDISRAMELTRWTDQQRRAFDDAHMQREETWRSTSASFHDSVKRKREATDTWVKEQLNLQTDLIKNQRDTTSQLLAEVQKLKQELAGSRPKGTSGQGASTPQTRSPTPEFLREVDRQVEASRNKSDGTKP